MHVHALDGLYASCEKRGVRRVIHVSAVGVEDANTLFARTKREADQKLMQRDLDWTILRPAVVIGEGSYGGTSALRAMAAMPFLLPVIGDGGTEMDFIHIDDLARAIVEIIENGGACRRILEPASKDRLSYREALQACRQWLGLPPVPVVMVPSGLTRVIARIGDFTNLGPLNSTALSQFNTRLTGDAEGFERATRIIPRGLQETFKGRPASTQDLWHARLYLLRPLVRLALIGLWLASGLLGLVAGPDQYDRILTVLALKPESASLLVVALSVMDILIAIALVFGWRLRELAMVQFVIVLGYTGILTAFSPSLWADPLGPILKNIPILALILVHRVLEQER